MSIPHDEGVGPETRHTAIKFSLIAVAQRHEPPRYDDIRLKVAVTSSPEATATLLTRSVLIGKTDLVTKSRNALYMPCAAELRAILVCRADTWGAVPKNKLRKCKL